jgi:replicative DNA helicase
MRGDGFTRESDYLQTILETRDRLVSGRLPFGNAYLDDALGGLYGDDLVVLGAAPGVGKTALVTSAVKAALHHGVPDVRLFALEATPGEVAARMAFEELARLESTSLDFADFWRGRTKQQEGEHWASVVKVLDPLLSRLHTLYKGRGDFTNATLAKHLAGIDSAGLVALDHLHVVDGTDGAENATQKKTVGLLRDLALDKNVPVIAASHIRKSQAGESRRLVPGMDDLLGSKHIAGIATVIVTVAPDRTGDRPQRHLYPTYFSVEKDRRGRASSLVARMLYDKYRGTYQDSYVLGRVKWGSQGQEFDPVPEKFLPHWAVRETRRTESKPF